MSDSTTTYETLKGLFSETLDKDYTKAQAGNKSACVRVRKVMQQARELAKTLRTELNDLRKQEKQKASAE